MSTTQIFKISEYIAGGFNINTIVSTAFSYAGVSQASAGKFGTMAQNALTQFSALDCSFWLRAENIESAVAIMTNYASIKVNDILKWGYLFDKAQVISLDERNTDTTTETRELENSVDKSAGINKTTENSPIGNSPESAINTPNFKDNTAHTETETGTDTGTVTTEHTYTAHAPIEDIKFIQNGGKSMFDIILEYVKQFIWEYNRIL